MMNLTQERTTIDELHAVFLGANERFGQGGRQLGRQGHPMRGLSRRGCLYPWVSAWGSPWASFPWGPAAPAELHAAGWRVAEPRVAELRAVGCHAAAPHAAGTAPVSAARLRGAPAAGTVAAFRPRPPAGARLGR